MSEVDFLTKHGWADATKTPLAGDASSRCYTRLKKATETVILMDEGPGSHESLDRFAHIARHLRSLGLSAPAILGADSDQFLLLEDLGDAVFARVIDQSPALETELYKAALDALIVSQRGPVPSGVQPYGPAEMAQADALVFNWYPTPDTFYSKEKTSNFLHILEALLTEHLTGNNVLVQRDFHAENLIWRPDRQGIARAGLLDFQDAVSGHAAYDVASLLVDARRDVSPRLRHEMIGYYCLETQIDRAEFETAFALCSAQRNIRILGIFARLAIRDKKPVYIDLIPRVWNNLVMDFSHPVLAHLRPELTAILPAPTSQVLDRIRAAHV